MSTTAPDPTKGITTDTTAPKITAPVPAPPVVQTVDATGFQISDSDLDRLADMVTTRLAQRQYSHNQGGFPSTGGPTAVISQSGQPWTQCSMCGSWAAPGVTHACANSAITPVPVTDSGIPAV